MMNLIITIIKTCFLSFGTGLFTYLILLGMFQDVVNAGFILHAFAVFFLLLTIGFAIVLYASLHLINKKYTFQKAFQSYLPIAVIPLLLFIVTILINDPGIFNEKEFQLIFSCCLMSYFVSFKIFFHSLAN